VLTFSRHKFTVQKCGIPQENVVKKVYSVHIVKITKFVRNVNPIS